MAGETEAYKICGNYVVPLHAHSPLMDSNKQEKGKKLGPST